MTPVEENLQRVTKEVSDETIQCFEVPQQLSQELEKSNGTVILRGKRIKPVAIAKPANDKRNIAGEGEKLVFVVCLLVDMAASRRVFPHLLTGASKSH